MTLSSRGARSTPVAREPHAQRPRRPDGRTTRHAHRRAELVAAAADHLGRSGFGELSMRPLAQAIGVTHATLVHHFGSKDALLAEVMRELRARDRELIAAEAERLRGLPAHALVTSAWERLSGPAYSAYWRAFFEAYGLALAEPARFGPFLDGVVADWLELIEAELRRLGAPRRRARALGTLVLSTFRGAILDLLVTGDRRRTGAAVTALAEQLTRELTASGAS
jgi:AcrR family transcriptional regulator